MLYGSIITFLVEIKCCNDIWATTQENVPSDNFFDIKETKFI